MRIVHVGLGTKGRQWLERAREFREAVPVAAVDPDEKARKWIKSRFPEVPSYASLEEALAGVIADAAIIASPLDLRSRQAVLALEAGLAVLIQKPFAAGLAEAREVLDTSRRMNRGVVIAQTQRFSRTERTLRKLVREGRVGRVRHVAMLDRCPEPAATSFGRLNDYSQLLEAGDGHFDSLRSVLGVNPVSIMARTGKAPWAPPPGGSTTEAMIEMERGIHVHYHGSLAALAEEHEIWLEGERGVIWTDRRFFWWRKRGWPRFIPMVTRGFGRKEPIGQEHEAGLGLLRDLKEAVSGSRSAETSGEDNVWTLAMVEAARESDRSRREVHIPALLRKLGVSRPQTIERSGA
jgi:predicted dehydrogenase